MIDRPTGLASDKDDKTNHRSIILHWWRLLFHSIPKKKKKTSNLGEYLTFDKILLQTNAVCEDPCPVSSPSPSTISPWVSSQNNHYPFS